MAMITVLGISGSQRWPSHTHTLLELALGAARESGARVELLDVRTVHLPLYEPRKTDAQPLAQEIRDRITDAHAYILSTPNYHGGMSGALKNVLDYLRDEASGKLFGLLVASGADQGETALAQLRETVSSLHGWSLPYGITASGDDFDAAEHLITPRIRDAVLRLGRDLTLYGEMLYEQFSRDRVLGGGVHLGFAPWHARG